MRNAFDGNVHSVALTACDSSFGRSYCQGVNGTYLDAGYHWIIFAINVAYAQIITTVSLETNRSFSLHKAEVMVANELSTMPDRVYGFRGVNFSEFLSCDFAPERQARKLDRYTFSCANAVRTNH